MSPCTDPDIDADVCQFTLDEQRCCQFWGFAVETGDMELSLRWDGPPATDELLDRLAAYFRRDESTTGVTDML